MNVNRRRIERYFESGYRPSRILALFALIAAGAGAAAVAVPELLVREAELEFELELGQTDVATIGLLVLALGLLHLLIVLVRATVSGWVRRGGRYVDRAIAHDVGLVDTHALEYVGLHNDQPMTIHGPSPRHSRIRRDGKGVLRFSATDVAVLIFDDTQLVVYQAVIDHITGKYLHESSHEVFYRFVAGVSISDESVTFRFGNDDREFQVNAAKTFQLALSGIDPIRVTLGNARLATELGGATMEPTDVESTINRVRKMVRDRHTA